MNCMTANELKTRGVSGIAELLENAEEVLITVRGADRYVLMDVEKYAKLREYELQAALEETRADVAAGRYRTGTVDDHMSEVLGDLE